MKARLLIPLMSYCGCDVEGPLTQSMTLKASARQIFLPNLHAGLLVKLLENS